MKTTKAKIDVFNGTLTMEYNAEIVRFNIFEAMRCHFDVNSYFLLMFWISLHNRTYSWKVRMNLMW